MKSKQVFKCPSNTSEAVVACSNVSNRVFSNYLGNGANYATAASGGFGYDRPLDEVNWSTGVAEARALAQAVEPSQTIIVAEYKGSGNRPNIASTSTGGGFDLTNHLTTTNYLFVDGHVKALKPMATVTGINMWSIQPTTTSVHNTLRNALSGQQAAM
jgi:prepilin-type processing-associated H-X9-DG protein